VVFHLSQLFKKIELCAKNQVFVFVEHVLITKYIVQPILKAKYAVRMRVSRELRVGGQK